MADAMLGPQLPAIWSRLDETQQAAVAEAVHHPLGEYSQRRFRARYQHLPAFHTTPPKASYSRRGQPTLLCLFIHDALEQPSAFIPSDLRDRLKAFVPPPAPLNLASSETLAGDDELMIRLTEREALQEVVVMLRTHGAGTRSGRREDFALPGSATLRSARAKNWPGVTFYPPGREAGRDGTRKSARSRPLPGRCCCRPADWRCVHGTRLALGPAGSQGAEHCRRQTCCAGSGESGSRRPCSMNSAASTRSRGRPRKGRVMTAAAPRRAGD
jgi:hypothetical protein